MKLIEQWLKTFYMKTKDWVSKNFLYENKRLGYGPFSNCGHLFKFNIYTNKHEFLQW